MSTSENRGVSRRSFLQSSGTVAAAAAAAVTIVRPSAVRGSQANSVVELGAIGCGGRGRWIADLFQKHGKYRYVACADYFQERADALGNARQVPSAARFTGLSGYKRLLEQKLDAVVIETPPYFHPEHAAAAVEAGKHVFAAKPLAVDVPGCLSIAASGKKATAKKLVFLVDFQTRANEAFRETARRIHAGQIGALVCAEGRYPTGGLAGPFRHKTAEDRLRYWYPIKELSGDFIVEQSIHALDVATWFLDAAPLWAMGTGGKGVRLQADIWDHFAVIFQFPKDVPLSFTCLQAIPGAPEEISCTALGSEGVAYGNYSSEVWIHGRHPYEGAKMKDLYTAGAVTNIADFHCAVSAGDCANATVAPSVRSNLTAILGRTAGYKKGRVVTWDEMLRAAERWQPDLSGLKD
jgi:predicted dehydrogenase